jgi:hypothetical protein
MLFLGLNNVRGYIHSAQSDYVFRVLYSIPVDVSWRIFFPDEEALYYKMYL